MLFPGYFIAITYWMIGLHQTFTRFLLCFLITALLAVVNTGLGLAISAVVSFLFLLIASSLLLLSTSTYLPIYSHRYGT